MPGTGFSEKDTEVLLKIRSNLLNGLSEVDRQLQLGNFNLVGPKGAAPPSQAGHLTLALLLAIQEELTARGEDLTW
jgi:hypothetical protein